MGRQTSRVSGQSQASPILRRPEGAAKGLHAQGGRRRRVCQTSSGTLVDVAITVVQDRSMPPRGAWTDKFTSLGDEVKHPQALTWAQVLACCKGRGANLGKERHAGLSC